MLEASQGPMYRAALNPSYMITAPPVSSGHALPEGQVVFRERV